MKGFKLLFFVILFGWGASSTSAGAQQAGNLIPVIDSAESVFSTAIQAYEGGDYATAARLFGVVANTFDLHQKTTAALLMRGKSFYKNGEYDLANRVLSDFINAYPMSRYVNEAQLVMDFATEGTDAAYIDDQVIKLGIALPLNNDASALTQQMFSGIRIAVENHNAAPPDSIMGPHRKIQMIFRDTNGQQGAAQEAIQSLAQQGVDAIIGPLFSSEAIAAARIADNEGIVMIAPMATEDQVSRNMRYVFQANPTIETRGRLMARLAVLGLGINEIGVLSDYTNNESTRMARAFANEIHSLNADNENLEVNLVFNESIPDPRTWFRLSEGMSKDTLAKADAIYLPFNGGNASTLIGGALTSLDRMGMSSRLRLLGNVEWHNIAQTSLASNYTTTYTNDFYVNPMDSLAMEFSNHYQSQTGESPSRLVFSGFDVATFLAQQLDRQVYTNRPLEQLIREAPFFQGYGIRLDFSKGNVNEAMFYHRYSAGIVELIR